MRDDVELLVPVRLSLDNRGGWRDNDRARRDPPSPVVISRTVPTEAHPGGPLQQWAFEKWQQRNEEILSRRLAIARALFLLLALARALSPPSPVDDKQLYKIPE